MLVGGFWPLKLDLLYFSIICKLFGSGILWLICQLSLLNLRERIRKNISLGSWSRVNKLLYIFYWKFFHKSWVGTPRFQTRAYWWLFSTFCCVEPFVHRNSEGCWSWSLGVVRFQRHWFNIAKKIATRGPPLLFRHFINHCISDWISCVRNKGRQKFLDLAIPNFMGSCWSSNLIFLALCLVAAVTNINLTSFAPHRIKGERFVCTHIGIQISWFVLNHIVPFWLRKVQGFLPPELLFVIKLRVCLDLTPKSVFPLKLVVSIAHLWGDIDFRKLTLELGHMVCTIADRTLVILFILFQDGVEW